MPESGCFIVEGSQGDKYAVTLAPTEKCNLLIYIFHIEAFMSLCASEVKYTLRIIWASTRDNPLSSVEAQI